MAEVMNLPVESLDRRGDRSEKSADDPPRSSSPPPPPPAAPPSRRRDRDERDRREDDRLPPRRGDYNDRDRSPPPPPMRDRDRDRDYRRRGSLSPPPPYRDRRSSPPQRRSPPPPYKRSRRDDGGYDGRRGSPRGGRFGHGDRRFGYGGGYDREMGGRPGYADDRPHGRFFGRSAGAYGPPEWDSGRGAFGDSSGAGSNQREGLMSYKQFIQELEDDILPGEAERRYQEYKSEYIATQKRTYFNAHRDEEWLKDKYHPTNLLAVIERRNESARKVAKGFLLDLQSGTLDLGPAFNTSASNKLGQVSDQNSEDEVDAGGKRKRGGKPTTNETDLLSAAPKAHPVSSEPRRIQLDVEQAQALVRKLDSEKGIQENILCGSDHDKSKEKSHSSSSGPVIIIRGLTAVRGLEGTELLDTLITYLWRIHGVDYYGMVETSDPKGLRHVRAEGKSAETGTNNNGAEWEKKLDSCWQERLQGQDPLEIMTAKEKIEAAATEGLDPFVRKIRDEKYGWKYGCGAKGCTKLFHAAEFVHKHLKLKHTEISLDLTVKVREELYLQNYMNDADAPGGTPVMQPSLQRDRVQRRRFGGDMRMRDERGSIIRRERDNRANGGERFDRSDNLIQSGDGPPDGTDPGNLDNPIFDGFNGQSLRVAPAYATDLAAPPLLMPVPGAGPLGPFVPAPPEVAMRMFQDTGGPSPFDGGVINGRPGPHGSAPIIALSQAMRQDPRRIRSYQDLDAPEDEVTVIDYRSL